jgi:hypothetical protein
MKKLFVLCLFLTGCATSPKIAQEALTKGQKANSQITQAFFIKGWGLNRALITEARQKWIYETQLNLLRAAANGNVSVADVDKLVENLGEQLGKDEIITSSNFAYLSFLLSSSETAQGYLDVVDFFIEAGKPTIEHLLKSGKENVNDTVDEMASWSQIIGNIKDNIPKFLKGVIQ